MDVNTTARASGDATVVAIAAALMQAAMQAMMVQKAPARSLAAVAAAIARSCVVAPLQRSPEVEDRLDLIRPCLAAQEKAAKEGLEARSSSGLVHSDVHVMSGAAKHQWQQPIATLRPKTARQGQRGKVISKAGNQDHRLPSVSGLDTTCSTIGLTDNDGDSVSCKSADGLWASIAVGTDAPICGAIESFDMGCDSDLEEQHSACPASNGTDESAAEADVSALVTATQAAADLAAAGLVSAGKAAAEDEGIAEDSAYELKFCRNGGLPSDAIPAATVLGEAASNSSPYAAEPATAEQAAGSGTPRCAGGSDGDKSGWLGAGRVAVWADIDAHEGRASEWDRSDGSSDCSLVDETDGTELSAMEAAAQIRHQNPMLNAWASWSVCLQESRACKQRELAACEAKLRVKTMHETAKAVRMHKADAITALGLELFSELETQHIAFLDCAKLRDATGVNSASLELQRIVDKCAKQIGKIGSTNGAGADDLGGTVSSPCR
eukprot:CAMPEP_0172811112 /NCGR_PEP_ID=MMETSP1075-20121228/9211_1 /TAXON_ID=2916 /ORGANISM="Ceratium fusus, Strain PA161109" /LENGTH=493 /DNA_ID=CAMNT_0013650503 /DNA_START=1 /DNA_END=1482 /DNA_ORIENTATION=-